MSFLRASLSWVLLLFCETPSPSFSLPQSLKILTAFYSDPLSVIALAALIELRCRRCFASLFSSAVQVELHAAAAFRWYRKYWSEEGARRALDKREEINILKGGQSRDFLPSVCAVRESDRVTDGGGVRWSSINKWRGTWCLKIYIYPVSHSKKKKKTNESTD